MATQARKFDENTLTMWRLSFVMFALLLVLPGCQMYFEAAAQGHFRQADGTVALLEGIYRVGSGKYPRSVHGSKAECGDADLCGNYEYSILAIYEDSVEYYIDPSWFQPALPRWFAENGERVHFWYTSGPLAASQIVAITLNARTYVTDNYTHPRTHILTTAGVATMFVIPGFGLLLLGIFLPRMAMRHPGLAESLKLNRVRAPAQRHHKYIPMRPVKRIAKGAPTVARRRARH